MLLLGNCIAYLHFNSDFSVVEHPESFWMPCSNGEVPPNAIPGGFDKELLFVGRAVHETALTPGRIIRSEGVCSLPWGGGEHKKSDYEVRYYCKILL